MTILLTSPMRKYAFSGIIVSMWFSNPYGQIHRNKHLNFNKLGIGLLKYLEKYVQMDYIPVVLLRDNIEQMRTWRNKYALPLNSLLFV